MTRVGVPRDVKEYLDAGHSFLNNHHDTFFKLLRIIHISYDEASARDGRRRIIEFFNRHLRTD